MRAPGDSGNERPARGAARQFHSTHGAVLIGTASLLFAWMSWRKWPDLLVDFGQQLYVPWRLACGGHLFSDVAYLYGGLSVEYHALLFKAFGTSLDVLLASNFLLLALLLAVVCGNFGKCADAVTGTMAGLAVVAVFAFAQNIDVGNYNYLCPYSHEVWHGVVLNAVLVSLFARWLVSGGKLLLAMAGLCLGLVALGKPETFLPACAVAFVAALIRLNQASARDAWRPALLFAGAALVPVAACFAGFRQAGDFSSALRSTFHAWVPMARSQIFATPFFRSGLGLDAPWFHLRQMLFEFTALAAIAGVCVWRLSRKEVSSVARVVLFSTVGALSINYGWHSCGHSLPLLVLAAAALLWTEWRAADAAARARLAFPALWLAFSLCLLLKLGLNVRITHYGVFLAMPAFLSAVYLLLHLLPRAIGRRGFGPQNFRIAMLILLLAGFARVGIHSALFYRDKDFPVGAAGDRMLGYNPAVDPRGAELAAAADWINAHTSPTDTLAALPEGLMLNYLTRRANPTPYGVFMTEFWAFGQERMAGAYRLHPPDYIALIHRDSAEFGVPYFGTSERYGLKLMQWVNENYEPVHLIGGEPLRTGKFGIKILKARPRAKILQPD